MAYESLPEVQEYSVLMQRIHEDYCLVRLTGKSLLLWYSTIDINNTDANFWTEFLGGAEGFLRQAMTFKLNENLDAHDPNLAGQSFVLTDISFQAIMRKLRTISLLTNSLHRDLKYREEK